MTLCSLCFFSELNILPRNNLVAQKDRWPQHRRLRLLPAFCYHPVLHPLEIFFDHQPLRCQLRTDSDRQSAWTAYLPSPRPH
ncbi:uncharacterized protein STEHIDRAFT_124639 [Stereum hirsutum FP-91666 SS1]|uniref:uncharacterized protein n=1 Tax=Stereum hirsutum (strain FP-91666) TaxID=721885 RepID=UPI0004449AE2|nr:uncharacterized protein STEHIDRAFT_124639 [Stereum hirsutum FP-91666 SS1]EIM82564.1 hypothetical protein STEHIDRAFT_124639 [Stereum hirsutum FP-91666 SS1]